jgi:ubiquinone/menaquinone biosynthesis C-methylase UbiE|tara:strand:+ start:195 stop:773 length:579 start_codon:yes stop_codon:yes gene_type:complete
MKLNLGCGNRKNEGWINVDKHKIFKPDVLHDLEKFPYPFEENSVDEILLSHVLEHIGQNPDIFINIIKEFYRVCKNGAYINIYVPHPFHDDFISDPTHVRPITIGTLQLFDKKLNLEWEESGSAHTPLALIHKVNLRLEEIKYDVEKDDIVIKEWVEKVQKGQITKKQLDQVLFKYNNLIKQIYFKCKVIKD